MTDEYDFARQNPDIKEYQRQNNKLKQEVREVLDKLAEIDNSDLKIADTRYGTAGGNTASSVISGSNSDSVNLNEEAQFDDVANVTPAASDEFLIEDADDSQSKKAVLFSALEAALSHDALADFTSTEHFTMLDEDDMASNSATQAATQQSIKAYVDAVTVSALADTEKLVVTPTYFRVFNDASITTKNRFVCALLPASDADCGAQWLFHLPEFFDEAKLNIKIRFAVSDTNTYSVQFYAASISNTSLSAGQDNILNADTTNDFTASVADTTEVKSIAINDGDVTPGGMFNLQISSDASNSGILYIFDVWLEADYS